jgi:hypothetical protein
MTDYDYYLVDCSGRSGALKVAEARVLKGEDVCGFLWEKYVVYHEYVYNCYSDDLFQKWSTKEWFYDQWVKCYPIAQDGSIVKDHSVMREIWLSYEREAQTQ